MAPASIQSCCLTSEQKDALIDAVRQRPVIWDCSLDAYQEVQNRRNAFVEVAELLSDDKTKYTGPEMQVEWKKLRDIFNRTLKKVVTTGGSDAEVTWRYWYKLQFIADHERSQICRAVHKWTKNMSPLPPSASAVASSSTTSIHQMRRRLRPTSSSSVTPRHRSPPAAGDSSISMVKQLAEVAHSAHEMLKVEAVGEAEHEQNHMEQHNGSPPAEGIKAEVSREGSIEEGAGGEEGDEGIGEALGQILLLSSQIAENGGNNNNDASGNTNNTNGGADQTAESDLPIRFLLNEWLKGAGDPMSSAGSNALANGNMNNATKRQHNGQTNGEAVNRRRRQQQSLTATLMVPQKQSRWEAPTVAANNGRAEVANGEDTQQKQHWRPAPQQQQNSQQQQQQQQYGSDQFDIFGMFVASQVRTLALHSPQAALSLKRALTELCFQFEAEENNSNNNNRTMTSSSVNNPSHSS